MVYPDNLAALELVQAQRDPNRPRATLEARWRLCGVSCARQFLALCVVRLKAQADPETAEAEA